MEITYDRSKNRKNLIERNLSFEDVIEFEFEGARLSIDERKDYGEIRIRAIGFLRCRLHTLVFTETEKGIRVISFRKANKRELTEYEKQIQDR
ncbi:BrnT family toxin [Polynucleobacter sp. AM-25C3]|jgi:uncharacterized DUF497 family protein|uniref:BrnT family toxin n=1 Tax=Polynucleobacter sp. AM-25C3 TaxID=1855569 RepID=UPI001C0C7DE5|nr:BrnT family toxin [Polynucleobacter sp. AM-25C3]MBU3602217.1 BrnT family toxin [Polynucleobacter sp. AM-25C3]